MKIKSYKQKDFINIEVRKGETAPEEVIEHNNSIYIRKGSRSWTDKIIYQYKLQ